MRRELVLYGSNTSLSNATHPGVSIPKGERRTYRGNEWTDCCELAKHNLKKLSRERFRDNCRVGASSLGSRLLFFSTILQRNF